MKRSATTGVDNLDAWRKPPIDGDAAQPVRLRKHDPTGLPRHGLLYSTPTHHSPKVTNPKASARCAGKEELQRGPPSSLCTAERNPWQPTATVLACFCGFCA